MKLIRTGQPGREKPGVLIGDKVFDASALCKDYDEAFFHSGGLEELGAYVASHADRLEPQGAGRIGPPVARPSKIVCVGLNYADHARETKANPPSEPVLFLKATTSFSGPFDDIIIPKNSVKTDWEVELAIVIGKKASYVSVEDAPNHIAGYCLHNDVSEREFQMERNGTWDKGKGCDTFAPVGPWLVTPGDIPDSNALRLWLTVNGETMQNGTTADLLFKIPFLISYTSQFMTLLPGDIISTGTPAGVGLGKSPQRFLKDGDIVELGIDHLGTARQKCTNYVAA